MPSPGASCSCATRRSPTSPTPGPRNKACCPSSAWMEPGSRGGPGSTPPSRRRAPYVLFVNRPTDDGLVLSESRCSSTPPCRWAWPGAARRRPRRHRSRPHRPRRPHRLHENLDDALGARRHRGDPHRPVLDGAGGAAVVLRRRPRRAAAAGDPGGHSYQPRWPTELDWPMACPPARPPVVIAPWGRWPRPCPRRRARGRPGRGDGARRRRAGRRRAGRRGGRASRRSSSRTAPSTT